jgi:hypothetical protein
MELVAKGMPNKLIADQLAISVRTVEVHRARVFDKMEVKSAVELANLLRRRAVQLLAGAAGWAAAAGCAGGVDCDAQPAMNISAAAAAPETRSFLMSIPSLWTIEMTTGAGRSKRPAFPVDALAAA